MIHDWIFEDSLHPFLAILSSFAGYSFDEGDEAAIEWGIQNTDVEKDAWFAYELAGEHPIRLTLARDPGTAVVVVRGEADHDTEMRIGVVITIAQWYRLQRGDRHVS